jgi:RNA polymerase sigma factor FliA
VEATNSHGPPATLTPAELQALVASAEGLVEHIAYQLIQECVDPIPKEDLVAYGHQGLLEAALRFEQERGASFRTFAYYRVRGAMIDGIRKMGPWTRRGLQQALLLRAAHVASEDLVQEHPDVPTLEPGDAAELLRKQMASMVTAMTTGLFSAKPQQLAPPDRSGTPQSSAWGGLVDVDEQKVRRQLVAPEDSSNAEEQLGRLQLNQLVKNVIAHLPPPEDEVVHRFYVDGHNMDLIAQDLGRSRSWVSRVHTRALSRIGARLRREALTG